MRWYADNSELFGVRETDIPDILLFGGIVVPADAERGLQNAIEAVKEEFCSPRAPVKWNFKDLKKLYERHESLPQYEKLLQNSKELRAAIFDEASKHNFQIVISCIESHSVMRNVIKDKKAALSGFAFANGLMRFGLCVQAAKPSSAQVVLDWPDKGEAEPFSREYAAAYIQGKSRAGVTYYCGPLNNLGFLDSVMYTTMVNSTLLQFTDLVVGATRELVDCAIGKRTECLGLDLARILRSKYYGAPNEIFGRGINVPSGNGRFRTSLRNFLSANF